MIAEKIPSRTEWFRVLQAYAGLVKLSVLWIEHQNIVDSKTFFHLFFVHSDQGFVGAELTYSEQI